MNKWPHPNFVASWLNRLAGLIYARSLKPNVNGLFYDLLKHFFAVTLSTFLHTWKNGYSPIISHNKILHIPRHNIFTAVNWLYILIKYIIAENVYDRLSIVNMQTGKAIILLRCDKSFRNSHISYKLRKMSGSV